MNYFRVGQDVVVVVCSRYGGATLRGAKRTKISRVLTSFVECSDGSRFQPDGAGVYPKKKDAGVNWYRLFHVDEDRPIVQEALEWVRTDDLRRKVRVMDPSDFTASQCERIMEIANEKS